MFRVDKPPVPPEVQAREDAWAAEQKACLARYTAAVSAARFKDWSKCEAIIESVRKRSGDAAANTCADEFRVALGQQPKYRKNPHKKEVA